MSSVASEYEAMEEKKKLLDSPRPDSPPLYLRLWRRDYLPAVPARYILALMSFLGFCNVYALRVNLSMAIVEMDNSTVTVRHGAKVSSSHSVCCCTYMHLTCTAVV